MLLYWRHPTVLVATESVSICATACSGLRIACRSLQALSASEWIFFLPLSQLSAGTNVGYGPVTTLFLSLIFFLMPAH